MKKDIETTLREAIAATKKAKELLDESMQREYGNKWKEEKRRQEIDKQRDNYEERKAMNFIRDSMGKV